VLDTKPSLLSLVCRDAWRNMSGTNPIAAKERYVNILLQVASEVSRS
jgi:hypothetical protein